MEKTLLLRYVSIFFIVIGLLGFVNQPILGIFAVNTTHNLLHLGSGALGWIAAKENRWTKLFALVMMVFYGFFALLGFLNGGQGSALFLGKILFNMADNFLNLLLAIALGYITFVHTSKE